MLRRIPLHWALAASTFVISLLFVTGANGYRLNSLPTAFGVSFVAAGCVWLSARHALAALVALSLFTVSLLALGVTFAVLDLTVFLVLFEVTLLTTLPWLTLAGVSFVLLTVNDLWQRMTVGGYFDPSLLYPALLTALAVGLGMQGRKARMQHAELITLRAAEHRRVVAEERQRIARDVHDVAAHHLSALVVHNRLAARIGTGEALRESAAFSAETAEQALDALRQVVGILAGDGPPPIHPAGQLGELDGIIERMRAAGLVVDAYLEPVADTDERVQLAVVRITQEALSNVLLHRGPGAVRLTVSREAAEVVVVVADDGVTDGREVVPSHGRGIAGMTARAAAIGGELSAGPSATGGWTVAARLPVSPVAVSRS